METIHIVVTKVRPGNWFELGDVYEVEAEPRPFIRTSGQKLLGYNLIDNAYNRKMHGKPVHNDMCVGEDSCEIIVRKNKEFKSLLQGE